MPAIHAANSLSGATVYTGPWNNHAKTLVSKLTWTTTHTAGSIFNSAVTAFIVLAASQSWGIVCYLIHQWRTSKEDRDGQHHQEQTLLRNSNQDVSSAIEWSRLGWAWRHDGEKSRRRAARLILVAIIHFLLFEAAAVLASYFYSTNSQVLVESPNCGYMYYPDVSVDVTTNATALSQLNAYYVDHRNTASWALSYARNCYSTIPSVECDFFVNRSIMSTWNTVPCPFDSSVCLINDGTGAVQVDSGYVNSGVDLGINSKSSESLDYRRVTTCAPLSTTGRQYNYPGKLQGDVLTGYDFGPVHYNQASQDSNYTFVYASYTSNLTDQAYDLSAQRSYLGDSSDSNFIPIPELNRTDADVVILFVTNLAQYTAPVDDPWFNGTQSIESSNGWGPAAYINPNPVMAMACMEQHQICEPGQRQVGTGCTELTGVSAVGETQLSGAQLQVGSALYYAMTANGLSDMVDALGARSLLANLFVIGADSVISAQPPATQWINEVVQFQNYFFAHAQRLLVNIASGPSIDVAGGLASSSFDSFVTPVSAENKTYLDICRSIKIVDPNYYSWNICGVAVTFAIGLLLILTNLTIEPAVRLARRITKRGQHKQDGWINDHVLHVQRQAFEKSGVKGWKGHDAAVPTTVRHHRFSSVSRLSGADGHDAAAAADSKEATVVEVRSIDSVALYSPMQSPTVPAQAHGSPSSSSPQGLGSGGASAGERDPFAKEFGGQKSA